MPTAVVWYIIYRRTDIREYSVYYIIIDIYFALERAETRV